MELKKGTQLDSHGIYMYGLLDEVDFTTAGQNDNMKWGHSVKLRFLTTKEIEKELNGTKVITKKTVTEVLTISCETEQELETKFTKYNDLIGKELLVPLINNSEKQTYKINDADLKVLDKK